MTNPLLDFTDRPQAMRYAICIQCPVRDLCPDRTLQPRQDVCKRGHLADRYANGGCKVCQRDKQRGTTTPPDVTLEGLSKRDESPPGHRKGLRDGHSAEHGYGWGSKDPGDGGHRPRA